MGRVIITIPMLFLFGTLPWTAHADDRVVAISVDPAVVRLAGPRAAFSLLVHGQTEDGRLVDRTISALYHAKDGTIAQVRATGILFAVGDGVTEVEVDADGYRRLVRVEVVDSARPRRLHFENDIEPILSRFGCNSAGCHGAAKGQNGFRLSVFGFDPSADYAAILKEGRGRRVLFEAPESGLLLAKPAGLVPHGGGLRIPKGSSEYETLRDWIATGAPLGDPLEPRIAKIRVEPGERLLTMKSRQRLRSYRAIQRWQGSGRHSAGEVPDEPGRCRLGCGQWRRHSG